MGKVIHVLLLALKGEVVRGMGLIKLVSTKCNKVTLFQGYKMSFTDFGYVL